MRVVSKLQRYGLATVCCVVAVAAAWPLDAPSSFFFLAVIVSNLYGGKGPGLFSVGLSALAFDYFFLPPRFHFAIEPSSYLRFVVFVGAALLITWLIETRRKIEALHRRIDDQYRLVAETAPDGIISIDGHNQITFVNPAATKMFQQDASELIGSPLTVLLPGCLQEHRRGVSELLGVRNDGTQFPVEVSFGTMLSGDQHTFTGFVRDVSGVKHAADALRKSESYLAEAQKLSQTGSFGWNVSTGQLSWSEETYRIVEYDPGTTPTLDLVLERIHPEDQVRVRSTFDRAVTGHTDLDFEHRLLMPGGSVKHVHVVAHAVRDESGNVEFVGAVTDISDRERVAMELRRSQTYLTEAQRLSHAGSWAWDTHRQQTVYWSAEMYQIYQRDASEGPPLTEELVKIHGLDWPVLIHAAERAVRERIDIDQTCSLALPDGSTRNVRIVGHPVVNASGEVVELVGTTMDITEQWQARAELEIALEKIQRLKDQLHDENLALREEVDQALMFEEIVGSSKALLRILSQVAKVAPTDSTVLILGETGTGKELIARAIHKRSNRSSRAFIRVNCAAIPQSLIASELFGHEKGAFTGAIQRHVGRFELAHGGTIFLDEIGELPAETQIALLRVLQEREFERVGGNQPISVDVRVLAATNRDLNAAIAGGMFRQDLFYRLNVFPILIPSLRERVDDIPILVEYLIDRYAKQAGKRMKNISKKTLELFQAYDWPGNIRELQNVVERAVVLSEGETFSVDETWLKREVPKESRLLSMPEKALGRLDADQERQIIEAALAECGGRIAGPSGAAAKLRIPRQTLDSKISSLGINKNRFKSA